MNYRIRETVIDYLPNVIDLITDPTIKGEIVSEDGKLSVFKFTDDQAVLGELVVLHRNWRGSISINGKVAIGEWDEPSSTLLIDANGGTCQVTGENLTVEVSALSLT